MASVRQTINAALRKLGRLAAGREPRAADTQDALESLQGMYTAWIASGSFGRLADVIPTTETYTAGEGERIFRTDPDALTVTLPEIVPMRSDPLPYDQERVTYPTNYEATDGSNRPPRDGAVVIVVDAFSTDSDTFIYDGTARLWQEVNGLGLDDNAPRSAADPQGLAACLALEIADQFGLDVLPGTQAQARRFMSAITSRFSMPREAAIGVYM